MKKFPLCKTIRLRKGFNEVFRAGFRVQGELVRLLCLHARDFPERRSRVGFAVGKKQCGSCGRNRGKRILREALRRLMPFVVPGLDIVATLKDADPKSGTSAAGVYADAARALAKRGMLTKDWPGAKWE